jgi:hypothetical protein
MAVMAPFVTWSAWARRTGESDPPLPRRWFRRLNDAMETPSGKTRAISALTS